jgi:hypothetical protein
MKRNISRVLFVLLLVISIPLCCLLASPDFAYKIKRSIINVPPPTPDPLIDEITNAFARYENGDIPFVDFSTITAFKWDRLYIIGPYSSYKELTYRFGTSWMTCYTNTTAYDGWVFLVFASEKKIVRCFDYPVDPYDFIPVISETGISTQEAHFILLESGAVGFANSK